jgi:polar amino acid transport system substrate-binding protein
MTRCRYIAGPALVAMVCAVAVSSGKLPADSVAKVRAKGTLIVATTATYAPNEFVRPNGHAVLGMDPDLARALAALLGRRVKFATVRFDAIIRGVASGKYDLGMSSITDTKARERLVDFITYFSAGTSFYVKTNAGPDVKSLAQLCGRTVAVVSGTTQYADAEAQTAACRRAGKRNVTVAVFPDHLSAYVALESSHGAVGMADSPVAAYIVKKSDGQLELTGKPYGLAPYGIALAKGNPLTKPILEGLKRLMARGTYRAVLTRWGIESGAIRNPTVNGATR